MGDHRLTSRRRFLKDGAAGVAGTMLLSTCSKPPPKADLRPRQGRTVVRTLGRTGLTLPVVSMGSVYAVNLVRAALDEGIVYIHTSSGYSEKNHERLMGEVFRGRDPDSYVIGTSPDLPYEFEPGRDRSVDLGTKIDPGLIGESLDGSLERLQVDAVDIYYLAGIGSREVTLFEPYMEAYDRLKRAGKIRFAGVITHENEPEVIRAAAESGVWDVVVTAYNFRQSHREDLREAIAEAAGAGLGIVAMKTQAGVYWDRSRTRMINMTAALKWVLQDENVHTAIPAFSSFDEMHEGLSIMDDLEMTPEERRDLGLGDRLALSGNFCQQCGQCRSQCPSDMDVPTWMRASMYAFGHGRITKAHETLSLRQISTPPCEACMRCTVSCALGHDVRSTMLDLARFLRQVDSRYGPAVSA
jgi:predicted aldo/keto reductase-like oxidoreductase